MIVYELTSAGMRLSNTKTPSDVSVFLRTLAFGESFTSIPVSQFEETRLSTMTTSTDRSVEIPLPWLEETELLETFASVIWNKRIPMPPFSDTSLSETGTLLESLRFTPVCALAEKLLLRIVTSSDWSTRSPNQFPDAVTLST